MNPERWRKIESICNSALDMEPDRCRAFLDEACAGDDSLRREVEQLLGLQSEAEGFIERPALEGIEGLAASGEFGSLSGKTLGHYRLGSRLGRGGMGEVFLAEDTSLDRKVALKFLPEVFTGDPARLARFEREAKLLASLNHPNIAAIYGLEQVEGKRFIVLELVEGETLERRLHKKALPMEEALGICRRIAEGLEAAHEKGVIHRDLKPANVMIDAGGDVKILDFGLAKALGDQTKSVADSRSPTITEAMTRPGVILGTAAYMSPEQARGKSVDKRADLWAFGCILYECLAGRRAFEGETITETLAAILKSDPDWQALPETVPSNIRFVLRRCLEKDGNRRLQNAADVRILIEDSFDAGESTKPARRSRLAWSLAAAFLVTTLALSLSHFRSKEPAVAEPVRFEIEPRTVLDWSGAFAVSPDGRHLAFSGTGADGRNCVWIRSLGSPEVRPVSGTESERILSIFWSPDGSRIIYASNRDGGALNLYQIPTSGTQDEELLLKTNEHKWPTSWSRDKRFLLYTTVDPQTRADLCVLPLEDRKPKEYVRTEANELDARFSPDMRRVAYVSDESGRYEVYVRDFTQSPGMQVETGVKVQVSAEGGLGPRWRQDGRELYYRTRDGKMMVVDVAAGSPFRPGVPRVLFETPPDPIVNSTQAIPLSAWDVTSDGKRFLLSIPSADTRPEPFHVILHWASLLK